ncbi:MAG: hypothetical protein ACLSHC_10095 [Bilophila wadsworthia]
MVILPPVARISAMSSNTVSGLAAVQKSPMASRPRTSAHAQAAAPTTEDVRPVGHGVMRQSFMRPLAAMALASSMESW